MKQNDVRPLLDEARRAVDESSDMLGRTWGVTDMSKPIHLLGVALRNLWLVVNFNEETPMASARNVQVFIDDDYENGCRQLADLFRLVAPQCEPCDSLVGLVSQVNNYIAGLRDDAERYRYLRDKKVCTLLDSVFGTRPSDRWEETLDECVDASRRRTDA